MLQRFPAGTRTSWYLNLRRSAAGCWSERNPRNWDFRRTSPSCDHRRAGCVRGAQDREEEIQQRLKKSREQLSQRENGTNQILESVDELRTVYPPPYVLIFPSDCPSRAYEIFMNCSGLPDGRFTMLVPGVENESVSLIRQIAKGEAHRKIRSRGPWFLSS